MSNISIQNQILIMMTIIIMSVIYSNSNPMKLTWKMMFLMILTNYLAYYFSIKSFLPMIMTMIMIGGLLMIYVMMMSMMPNQKMKNWKMSKNKFMKMYFMMMSMSMTSNLMEMKMSSLELKLIMSNSYQFYFLMIFMTMYFLMNMIMLESEKTSLRSTN